jgi:hypothetical protein
MPLLEADTFAYQFYSAEKPQNDRSPGIFTDRNPHIRCLVCDPIFVFFTLKSNKKRNDMANESNEEGVNKVELIAREDVASDPDDCTDDSADDCEDTQGDELADEEALARINELTARLDHGPLIKTAC